MKQVLSLLLAFVFFQTQTWALSGGPDYTRGQNATTSLIGTYGGVLVPISTTFNAAAAAVGSSQAESFGVFSLGVTQTGFATGTTVIFVRGTPFNGTITGSADSDKKRIQGVMEATSTYNVIIPAQLLGFGPGPDFDPIFSEEQSFPVLASGSIDVRVREGNAGAFTPSTGTGTPLEVGSTFSARLSGEATVDTFFGVNNDGTPDVNETTIFEVDGFKQSNL